MWRLIYIFGEKQHVIGRLSQKDRDTPASFLLRYLHNTIGAARIKEIEYNESIFVENFCVDNQGMVNHFKVEGKTYEAKEKLGQLTNEWKRIVKEYEELEREKREATKRRVEQQELENMKRVVRAEVKKNEDGSWEVY